jgi:hypothetical protein
VRRRIVKSVSLCSCYGVSVKRVKQATHLSTVVSALSIEEKNKAIRLRDIVAYGIGNFASKSYSAPMLQLLIKFWRRKGTTL